jgi:Lar family restriction alleviation protein
MSEELKPCPWCGPGQVSAGHTNRNLFRAGCETCGIEWTRPTYAEAVELWNRRTL